MTSTRGRSRIPVSDAAIVSLAEAALDQEPVAGWTHGFYRYPARFSPRFAATAIDLFSQPGDLILDPYMGGGTSVVEGLVAGRRVVGNDLNSLATFVAKVKTTPLSQADAVALREWVEVDVPTFSYRYPADDLVGFIDVAKTKNLHLDRARFIKKAAAAGLASVVRLPSQNAQDFARAALLRVSQWALDGRKSHTSLGAFRDRLSTVAQEMLRAIDALGTRLVASGGKAILVNGNAASLPDASVFQREKASLVVTSPPYPGVHVLYHRWQVDGRRESPAPYWISGCSDGQGASFYNFGDRRKEAADDYFMTSLVTLTAIRQVVRDGAFVVQLLAFNKPDEQLTRYLSNMRLAGFAEVPAFARSRIWRKVPNRKWHANYRGETNGAREVVLVHQAV